MNELNTLLLSEAINLGLCEKWQNDWGKGDWTQQKMIDKMFEGLDFCIVHHWPSNEFIRRHFPASLLRKNNVFVNDVRSTLNPEHCLILGNSKITCRYNSRWVGAIHVRDTSQVEVTVKNNAFTVIHLYDQAKAVIHQKDWAKVLVVKHSDATSVTKDGLVEIRTELFSLHT